MPPKNRTMRKAVRKELLTFLREFDQRNVTIQDNLRRFEKLCKEGRDPEQLLIEIYDSFYAIRSRSTHGKTLTERPCSITCACWAIVTLSSICYRGFKHQN